jgi:hypothetical protein
VREREFPTFVGEVKIGPGEASLLAWRVSLLSASELRESQISEGQGGDVVEAGRGVHG